MTCGAASGFLRDPTGLIVAISLCAVVSVYDLAGGNRLERCSFNEPLWEDGGATRYPAWHASSDCDSYVWLFAKPAPKRGPILGAK